jgi:hypothetical protein
MNLLSGLLNSDLAPTKKDERLSRSLFIPRRRPRRCRWCPLRAAITGNTALRLSRCS